MKISHLIRELRTAMDILGDVPVTTEGCDCQGDSWSVGLDGVDDEVIICRSPRPNRQKGEKYYDNLDDTPEPLG